MHSGPIFIFVHVFSLIWFNMRSTRISCHFACFFVYTKDGGWLVCMFVCCFFNQSYACAVKEKQVANLINQRLGEETHSYLSGE